MSLMVTLQGLPAQSIGASHQRRFPGMLVLLNGLLLIASIGTGMQEVLAQASTDSEEIPATNGSAGGSAGHIIQRYGIMIFARQIPHLYQCSDTTSLNKVTPTFSIEW